MIAIYTLCAWIAWTPAWDFTLEQDVEAHYFYEDSLPGIVAWNNEIHRCRPEEDGFDRAITYSVAGFVSDPENEGQLLIGPESDDLTVIWPSEPVPEPEAWMMLLAGWVAIHGLLHYRNWRRRK
jgi:hypothetical protein